jgi:hypothetical protein
LLLSASQAIGDGIEEAGGAPALALVIDDDGAGILAVAVVAELDLLVAEIDGGFVASSGEAEGVVFLDLAGGLGVEQFVVVFGRRQEADAGEVDAEAVEGFHADGVMLDRVVVVFTPVGELAVEGFEGREVELFDEELVADAAEEAFDFALRLSRQLHPIALVANQPFR